MAAGDRLGIVPGGIAEIFEGYPKAGVGPHEECAVVRRGFLRLCARHNVPVVPVYAFGATKMFHRLHLPALERLSRILRTSLVIFFGVWGLPIPFRQRLSYVVGDPILPHPIPASATTSEDAIGQQVDDMHARFCNELLRLFERHKEAYGWGHKSLKLITT
jgi:Diacylglycerol acyltransferase